MKIIIESKHLPTIFTLKHGGVPTGITIEIPEVIERRGVDFETVATAILMIGSNVAAGVLANWLYEKLRGKPTTRLTINRTEVQITTKDEIMRVVQEEITNEEKP